MHACVLCLSYLEFSDGYATHFAVHLITPALARTVSCVLGRQQQRGKKKPDKVGGWVGGLGGREVTWVVWVGGWVVPVEREGGRVLLGGDPVQVDQGGDQALGGAARGPSLEWVGGWLSCVDS